MHGPHHSAQKSTSTGTLSDRVSTRSSKVASVTSRTNSDATGGAALPAGPAADGAATGAAGLAREDRSTAPAMFRSVGRMRICPSNTGRPPGMPGGRPERTNPGPDCREAA